MSGPSAQDIERTGTGTGERDRAGRKARIKEKVVDEMKRLFVIFAYLWVLFAIFSLHETLVLAEHHIGYLPFGVAFFNALVFAKIMIVADAFHLGRRMEESPLVYSILYKSAVFAAVFVSFHILEVVGIGALRGRDFAESIREVGGGRILGILSGAVIVTFALIPFFSYRELSRVIGRNELHALLFRPRPSAEGEAPQGS